MRKTNKQAGLNPTIELFKFAAIGALVGLVCCIIFSLLAAIILTTVDLPHRSIMPISMAIIGVSMLIGSFVSGRVFYKKGLFLGLIVGAISFLVLFIAGIFVPDEGIGISVLIKAVLCIVPSVVGAVAGVNTRKRY